MVMFYLRDLVKQADIVSKISGHISRPRISYLSTKLTIHWTTKKPIRDDGDNVLITNKFNVDKGYIAHQTP